MEIRGRGISGIVPSQFQGKAGVTPFAIDRALLEVGGVKADGVLWSLYRSQWAEICLTVRGNVMWNRCREASQAGPGEVSGWSGLESASPPGADMSSLPA